MAMNMRSLRCRLPLLAFASLLLTGSVRPQNSRHTIRFTFSYDFRITPACSATVKDKCVQQFNFYDISKGVASRVKLGSMPVPAGASGFVEEIGGTSKETLFKPGKHKVAVAAQMPDGTESDLERCTTIVEIH